MVLSTRRIFSNQSKGICSTRRKRTVISPNEDFAKVVHVLMLIVVVVQDEFSFPFLVVLNAEDVIVVDIQGIPINTNEICIM